MSNTATEIKEVAESPPDYSLIQPFLNGLKPIRRISVSQWADSYRVLGPAVSNNAGQWDTNYTPYLRAPMDALSVFEPYKEVVFMKGARIGATAAGENFLGYCMHITPAPILLMYPTVKVAQRMSKRRIATLISDSPVLKNIVSSPKSRDGSNTILEKDFPGGNILICGANSTSDLKAISVRFFLPDEVDEYPSDLGEQGDIIEMAKVRTFTYDENKKIFYISTPTVKGVSNIEALFEETDQHYYFVPCPHCAPNAPITPHDFKEQFAATPPPGYQKLVLEQFEFTIGNAAAVYYRCIHCNKEIHNYHKEFFLPRGKWVPECPAKSSLDKIGFHLNSFYSPIGMYSWKTMADGYQKALKDTLKMKTFVQTTEGKPYEQEGEQPPYMALFQRAVASNYQTNVIPDEVCFLTCGIDVQKDRLELEIVGWGKGKRSYSIDYRIINGRPEEQFVWNELAKVLSETWARESDGFVFGLSMTLIDDGYLTNEVYAFALSQGLSRILPCRGRDTQSIPISAPQPVFLKRDGKKSESLKHVNISTDYFKTALYAQLRLNRTTETGLNGPESYCHFPKNYSEQHYKQLTIERKVTAPGSKGYDAAVWKKPPGARNEQLDTRVYAMAAATLFGIDRMTDTDYDKVSGAPTKQAAIKKPVKRFPNNLPPMGGLPDL